MAVIFTYPPLNAGNLQSGDLFIISQMNVAGNPTKNVSLGAVATYISNNITPPPAVIPYKW